MTIAQAVFLATIEGITEFLPISSTGHMIIGSSLMGIAADPYVKVFTVCIQFGAILSVLVYYWSRFFKSVDFYFKLVYAFIPTAILGLLLKKHIDNLLENVWVVAISLLLGGVVLIFVDKWFEKNETEGKTEPSPVSAFIIGIFQAVSMIPGVSRSAASIIGGLSQKLSRKAAAEFSFFLAVPTMFAATVKSLWDEKEMLAQADLKPMIVGNVVAFIVAIIAIRFFIAILTRYGFKAFGYYRIVVGTVLLILLLSTVNLEIL